MTIQNRIRLSLIVLATVLLVGIVGFHYIEGWPWFDGLYMTLITMTTIGYTEVHPMSPAGRVFNVFLIIAAVMAGGFLVATGTQAMLEFELTSILGRRRMEREIAKLKDHYIICGAGGGGGAAPWRASCAPAASPSFWWRRKRRAPSGRWTKASPCSSPPEPPKKACARRALRPPRD